MIKQWSNYAVFENQNFQHKRFKNQWQNSHFEYELKELHEIIFLPLKKNSE